MPSPVERALPLCLRPAADSHRAMGSDTERSQQAGRRWISPLRCSLPPTHAAWVISVNYHGAHSGWASAACPSKASPKNVASWATKFAPGCRKGPRFSYTSLEGSSVPGPLPGLDPSTSTCPPPAQPTLPGLPRACSHATECLWLASHRELPAQPGCERLSLQKWSSEPWRRWRWRWWVTYKIGRDWKSSWFILSDWRIFRISV